MANTRTSITGLAQEAGLAVEEALFLLRDADIDYRNDRRALNKHALKRARSALGLPSREDLISPQYWQDLLATEEEEFARLLQRLGITGYRAGKRLPPNAVRRLKAERERRETEAGLPIKPLPLSTHAEEKAEEIARRAIPPRAERRRDHFVFRVPNGNEKAEIQWLDRRDIIAIHEELARDFAKAHDPISPAGVRDVNMLESACFHPQTASFTSRKYSTIESAAAALLFALVKNHAFHNGNKRTALVSMLAFLDVNGMYPRQCSSEDLFEITLDTAKGKVAKDNTFGNPDREVHALANWIGEKFRLTELGDRQLQWSKLKRILRNYGCTCQALPGNRLNIDRSVERKTPWRTTKRRTLRSQVSCKNDGADADLGTIKKIRAELMLDDKSGVDSKEFYSKSRWEPGDFVRRYRKILRRLGRF